MKCHTLNCKASTATHHASAQPTLFEHMPQTFTAILSFIVPTPADTPLDKKERVAIMRTAYALALLLAAAVCTEAAYGPSQTTKIAENVRRIAQRNCFQRLRSKAVACSS